MTEKQALKRMAEIMRDVNAANHNPLSVATLEQYVNERFRPLHVEFCKPAGVKHYEHLLRAHILPDFGAMPLREIKPDEVRRLILAKALRYAPETLRKVRTCLSTILTHAHEAGFVEINPVPRRLKLPERYRPTVTAFSWQEADRIFTALPSPIWEMCYLSATTSLNVAELCGIRVRRVNLTPHPAVVDGDVIPARAIAVREHFYEGRWGSLKTGKRRRDVPIPEELLGPLKKLCEGKAPEDPLFANRTGKRPIDAHNVTNRLFRLLSRDPNAKPDPDETEAEKRVPRLGIKVNWHRFRHSQATFSDFLGAEQRDRSAMLGHGSPGITARYTHDFERRRMIAEAIGKRLLKTEGPIQ